MPDEHLYPCDADRPKLGETIKSYVTDDVGARQSIVELENFIGDVEGAELADNIVFDASDAVTALNGLIIALEQRDKEIARLREILAEANNTWRHSFEDEVTAATDRLFKKLSAHQTDPFGRRVGTARITADHPAAQAALKENMPLA